MSFFGFLARKKLVCLHLAKMEKACVLKVRSHKNQVLADREWACLASLKLFNFRYNNFSQVYVGLIEFELNHSELPGLERYKKFVVW